MCGIAGAVGLEHDQAQQAVAAMCASMRPRGPDDGGIESFQSPNGSSVIGSRRLAIIDLSRAGHQPMHDLGRGTAIVFNGMIYNFKSLREQLRHEGETFGSECDTEVVLRAYGRYGRDCVRHLEGMFAFAIWDCRDNTLFLGRDRLGIKPLYLSQQRDRLIFASQVKALLAGGLVAPELSERGVTSYLEFGAIAEPATAIAGVTPLPAGSTATLAGGVISVDSYWTPSDASPEPGDRTEAVLELQRLLREAVDRHIISDAPLGVFLSGGVDSSILAALATDTTSQVRTFSVVFEEAGYSEETFSRAVANAIGSDHREVRMSGEDLLQLLPDAFHAMDQPTADGINTFAVSRAAAESGLKVALSGLGADELFNGYGQVGRVRAMEAARILPAPFTRSLALLPLSNPKVTAWLRGCPRGSSYELLRRLFLPSDVAALTRCSAESGIPRLPKVDTRGDLVNQVSTRELKGYLKNTLLRDTDAMSMANSLEVRVPFLHDPIVDWTSRLPGHIKGRRPKGLLLDAVRDQLPREAWDRPKQGFVLPIGEWLRGGLRSEVTRLLDEPPDIVTSLVDPRIMSQVWKTFLAGDPRWHRPWALYALCRWAEGITGTSASA